MNTLYWFGVLGRLHNVSFWISAPFTIFVILLTIFFFVTLDGNDDDKRMHNLIAKVMKYVYITSAISMLGNIVIPSKQELYFIYGVGSTIDYIKGNSTIKQIPDKFILAIDKYLDEQLESDKSIKNKSNEKH